jgi:hypothetical protein
VKTDRHGERKVIKTFVKSAKTDLAGLQCCSNNVLPVFVSTELKNAVVDPSRFSN